LNGGQQESDEDPDDGDDDQHFDQREAGRSKATISCFQGRPFRGSRGGNFAMRDAYLLLSVNPGSISRQWPDAR
jgi:hypothetical protein